MRKTISVLLIVLVALMMFTACNPESSITDALVKVRLVDNSRALSANLNFDVNKVKRWEYSAVKADNGLKTGETKGPTGAVITAELDENKQTAALSQGAWNFYLYGYDAEAGGNLICKGSALDALITSEKNSVSITVNPLQEETGLIAIDDSIVIVDKNGIPYNKGTGDDEYTKTVTVIKFSDSTVVTADAAQSTEGFTTYSVDSGTYKVVVTYTATHNGTTYTAATATKYINVYDHLTTTVSGTITESEQAATINAEGNFEGTATITATFESTTIDGTNVNANNAETRLTFDYTPVGKKGTAASGTDNLESTFVFPAGSLKKTGDTVSIDYKTASAGTAAKTYEVTDATGAVVAAVDITANGFDSTNLKGTDGTYPVLTTFIGKNLGASFDTTDTDNSNDTVTLGIKYYGDFVESDEDKAVLLAYDSETGYLKYSPKHFSTYIIFSNKYTLTDDNGSMYETLEDAIENAADGATITLWKDETIQLTSSISIKDKALTVDLNNKTLSLIGFDGITIKSSTNTAETENPDIVTFRNGNIYGTIGSTFIIEQGGALSLENVKVNVENTSGSKCIVYLYEGANPAVLSVKDSKLYMNGVYGISTNATSGGTTKVYISIENSTVKATSSDEDNTGLLVNVPSEVIIKNSLISGDRQGAILRGGNYKISNTTFISSGTKTNYYESGDYLDKKWATGNEVSLAALVIGNRGTSYKYPTTVEFKGSNTLEVAESTVRKQLYVYQADAIEGVDRSVTVTGDINPVWTINSDRNGANYPTAKVGDTTYSTLQAAIDAVTGTGDTKITLLCDTTGSGIKTPDTSASVSAGSKGNIEIDFGGHTYVMRDPAVGSTGYETQAMHWGPSASSITLKNGSLKVAANAENVKMAMQSHTTFTAEDMVFDFENVQVSNYDDIEKYGEWRKLEVPIFNNNKGKTMTLKNCTISMPSASTKGISAVDSEKNKTTGKVYGGELILDNTAIKGSVNLSSTEGKLTVKNGSTISGNIVSYFGGYTVNSTTDGSGVTTYTLKATT